jgi:hypothetical protein
MPTIPSTDAEFQAWLDAHPHGFVVNCYRNPTPSYLKLHRANCHTIRSDQRQNYAGHDYLKVCSTRKADLQEWAAHEIGGTLDPCGACNP